MINTVVNVPVKQNKTKNKQKVKCILYLSS